MYHICKICNKSLNSEKQLINHEEGKSHLSKLKNINNRIKKKKIKTNKQLSYSIVNHPINGLLCKRLCNEHTNILNEFRNCYNGCTDNFVVLDCKTHNKSLDCYKCTIGYENKYIIKCGVKTCKYIDKVDHIPVCCEKCGNIFKDDLNLSRSCIEENLFKKCPGPGCETKLCIGDFKMSIIPIQDTELAVICTNCGLPSCSECYLQCDLCHKNNFCMFCDFDHSIDFGNECKDSLDMCICNDCHNKNSKCKHPSKVVIGLNIEDNIDHESIINTINLLTKKYNCDFVPICFLLNHDNNNTKKLKVIIQDNFKTFVLQAPSIYSNIQKESWLAINSSILLTFNTTFHNFNNVVTIFDKLKKNNNNHYFEKTFYYQ